MDLTTEAKNRNDVSDCHADRPDGRSIGCDASGLPDCPSSTEPQDKPVVVVLIGYYLPAFKAGGPLRSVESLVKALGSEFCFKIVTRDRDLREKLPFPGIVANRWVRVGDADVMYLRPGLRGLLSLWALLRSLDRRTILYLKSFCSRPFSILPVVMYRLGLCRPQCVVLAPGGEFSAGALQLKRLRKFLYIRMTRWLGLYYRLIWHASSDLEVADIRRQFPRVRHIDVAHAITNLNVTHSTMRRRAGVITAPDIAGVAPQEQPEMRPKKPGQLRAVFVSRVARMKNLAGALRMLEGVSGNVSYDIYGPAEDAAYWAECQGLIAALPANIRVKYWGPIEHEQVARVFAEHDLFLLPTLGENYGHVICEALAAGCPVLISDQTPWRNLEAEGVGWALPLGETERFRSVLQQCVDAGTEWYAVLSARAMRYGVKHATDPETIAANRRLFQQAFAWPSSSHSNRSTG